MCSSHASHKATIYCFLATLRLFVLQSVFSKIHAFLLFSSLSRVPHLTYCTDSLNHCTCSLNYCNSPNLFQQFFIFYCFIIGPICYPFFFSIILLHFSTSLLWSSSNSLHLFLKLFFYFFFSFAHK